MTYITHKKFDGESISGHIVIDAGTELNDLDGVLFLGRYAICCTKSENAHRHFARNNDGLGLKRGELTQRILAALSPADDIKWDAIMSDNICNKYKRKEFNDYWLWNHEFFEAPILDLRYIAELIGA